MRRAQADVAREFGHRGSRADPGAQQILHLVDGRRGAPSVVHLQRQRAQQVPRGAGGGLDGCRGLVALEVLEHLVGEGGGAVEVAEAGDRAIARHAARGEQARDRGAVGVQPENRPRVGRVGEIRMGQAGCRDDDVPALHRELRSGRGEQPGASGADDDHELFDAVVPRHPVPFRVREVAGVGDDELGGRRRLEVGLHQGPRQHRHGFSAEAGPDVHGDSLHRRFVYVEPRKRPVGRVVRFIDCWT
jgi:hypothetical protein